MHGKVCKEEGQTGEKKTYHRMVTKLPTREEDLCAGSDVLFLVIESSKWTTSHSKATIYLHSQVEPPSTSCLIDHLAQGGRGGNSQLRMVNHQQWVPRLACMVKDGNKHQSDVNDTVNTTSEHDADAQEANPQPPPKGGGRGRTAAHRNPRAWKTTQAPTKNPDHTRQGVGNWSGSNDGSDMIHGKIVAKGSIEKRGGGLITVLLSTDKGTVNKNKEICLVSVVDQK